MPATLRIPDVGTAAGTGAPASTRTPGHVSRRAGQLALVAGAIAIYVLGASEHAQRMNTVKAKGDQSAYVQYAKDVYANRHGQLPPILGDRNRMPVYPAIQSLFYSPSLSDEEFFRLGRKTSIVLSVLLLLVIWAASASTLTPLASLTVTLVAAFTCFVFKAGYFQADLTYYSLHFLTFVAACRLLSMPPGRAAIGVAALVGALAALAYLTKAASLPLIALTVACVLLAPLSDRRAGARVASGRRARPVSWRLGAAAALVMTFLAVLSPYLLTSKRVFGHYFYNVNSTFYLWYDEWGDAIKGTRAHGDRVGWPSLPPDQLPGPIKYWREHSIPQIGARVAAGFTLMLVDLWKGFWALKFAVIFVALAGVAAWRRRVLVPALVRNDLPLVAFAALYFAGYLTLAAFYAPISGTGVARFTLALFLPLLFTASAVFHHPAFDEATLHGPKWSVRFDWFILATLALDVPFSIWPRLLTTYGGF
jgi:hypothetical protein